MVETINATIKTTKTVEYAADNSAAAKIKHMDNWLDTFWQLGTKFGCFLGREWSSGFF